MVASRKSSHRGSETTPRHAWLAALGLFVVARREAVTAVDIAFEEAIKLRKRAVGFGADARAIARGGAITLREQVEPVIAQVGASIEARLAPVFGPILEKLGLPSVGLHASRTPRNAKARKTTKTSSARRAAPGKVAKRRAPARASG